MSTLANATLQLGIIPEHVLTAARKWGVDIPEQSSGGSLDALVEAAELDKEVFIRETDPDAVKSFLATQKPAVLSVATKPGVSESMSVTIGRLRTGEFLLAWSGDDIQDLLTNGLTHLDLDGSTIYFQSSRELYLGDQKAFIVLTPVTEGAAWTP